MSSELFKASVQYNDLLGSSAADGADMGSALQWLKSRKLIKDSEVLLGISATFFPSPLAQQPNIVVSTSFFVIESANFDAAAALVRQDDIISGRKISHDMTPADFFSFFKRFDITLSSGGILEGREFDSE